MMKGPQREELMSLLGTLGRFGWQRVLKDA